MLVLGIALAMLPAGAAADARVYGRIAIPAPAAGAAFDLHLAREDLDLRYDRGPDGEPLESRRIGVSFHEPLSPEVRMGVRLGAVALSQSGRAATREADPSGHYIELDFAGAWPAHGPVRAALGASWRYAVADGTDDAGNETRLEWQTLELRPGVLFGLTERVAARVGVSMTAISGDERRRGPSLNESSGFEADGTIGGLIALSFHPAPDDAVIFRLRGGQASGAYISFEHRY